MPGLLKLGLFIKGGFTMRTFMSGVVLLVTLAVSSHTGERSGGTVIPEGSTVKLILLRQVVGAGGID